MNRPGKTGFRVRVSKKKQDTNVSTPLCNLSLFNDTDFVMLRVILLRRANALGARKLLKSWMRKKLSPFQRKQRQQKQQRQQRHPNARALQPRLGLTQMVAKLNSPQAQRKNLPKDERRKPRTMLPLRRRVPLQLRLEVEVPKPKHLRLWKLKNPQPLASLLQRLICKVSLRIPGELVPDEKLTSI